MIKTDRFISFENDAPGSITPFCGGLPTEMVERLDRGRLTLSQHPKWKDRSDIEIDEVVEYIVGRYFYEVDKGSK